MSRFKQAFYITTNDTFLPILYELKKITSLFTLTTNKLSTSNAFLWKYFLFLRK